MLKFVIILKWYLISGKHPLTPAVMSHNNLRCCDPQFENQLQKTSDDESQMFWKQCGWSGSLPVTSGSPFLLTLLWPTWWSVDLFFCFHIVCFAFALQRIMACLCWLRGFFHPILSCSVVDTLPHHILSIGVSWNASAGYLKLLLEPSMFQWQCSVAQYN